MDATPILEKIAAEGSSQSFSNYIKSVAKEVDGGNIYVIGSEGGDYTPSEILPKENILDKLHLLAPEFDYIFLEGPPLNDFTDSKELLHYVDSVIAIFSATHIIKQIDKESIQFFKEINGKFCGSVLNKVDLENVNAI
jgi:Mrp family chromosome partitioning ATPase